ncbi:chloride channel protein EriC [Longilinea arvoryzae]|uniref:Chloride channel protein EriC n=1 Tax=Longilinea arvoryzae TaxID=360412 RepID=A0A0K8MZB9_9CHLR|nr:chloride channel protein [Longilinea arvoryzae]GAP15977.1 chloride channel protein EriC [Longilinea arvoryzae]
MPFLHSLRRKLETLLQSPALFDSLLGILIGIFTAAGVWLFKRLIDLFNLFFYGWGASVLPRFMDILFPVLGGLAVGWLVQHFVDPRGLHGVAGVMESTALAGGRLPVRALPVKTLAAALSIGSGASVGPEDPSVQIGANLASGLGQRLRLTDARMRSLVAAGAAAGIAAAFNAPIAGVFFAVEIILGEISGGLLSTVVLASVSSAVLTQAVSGSQPAFRVPAYAYHSALELPAYLALGIAAGVISIVYIRLLDGARGWFKRLPLPRWLHPAAAGLAVGLAGLVLPGILGVGYGSIEAILGGKSLGVGLLLALLIGKLVLTPISIGGGFQGGVFAPALFLGACLGALTGVVGNRLLPSLNLEPAAFAMVGMAAVLGGAVRAPLTAILLLFEMTNDYRIILPLMAAVITSLLIAHWGVEGSVYTLGLLRRGLRLDRGREVEVLSGVRVDEVMEREPQTLRANMTLREASAQLLAAHEHGQAVINQDGELFGMLALEDLERIRLQAPREELDLNGDAPHPDSPQSSGEMLTVGAICTRRPVLAFTDEPLSLAVQRMSNADVGRLPVVERQQPSHLVGMLRRMDVVRAYNLALTRHAAERHAAGKRRLDVYTGAGLTVSDFLVQPGSHCDGRTLAEITWPQNGLVASIRRGLEVIVPHGETRLQAGDEIVVVHEEGARAEVAALCSREE